MELDYPGGNTVWNVATSVIAQITANGVQMYGFKNLSIILELVKK